MNIGMFPMSGTRCCDEELLRIGLTLPGFIERSKTIASLPSLGLLTLAGMTPEMHLVKYIEVPDVTQLETLPEDIDIAAISSYSAQIDEAYELARRFKTLGVPTVIGGPHVTSLPDEAAQHCDAVVVGEGESSWLQVLDDIEHNQLQQFYHPDANGFDLADSPMPAFEMLDISKYNRLTIQTSRGCPYRCEFCAGSVLLTDKYKQKPVDKVLDEIEKILTLWKRPFIEFADDNSFVNRAYWKELLKALKVKKIKWFAETDISIADDEELLDLMRKAGCVQVLVGLESPIESGLHGLELRTDWKFKKFSHYKEAIRTIQSHGITVNGCFVLGLDGHTSDIFGQVFEFVQKTELYEVQVTILTPFPGTPLYARLQKEDRLVEPLNWKKCTLFDINFKPAQMTTGELREGFKSLIVDLYSNDFTNWRRNRFQHNAWEQHQKKGART